MRTLVGGGDLKALWTMVARPWFRGPDDPHLELIRVTPGRAEVRDSPNDSAMRVLAMAAPVVAGHGPGLGTGTGTGTL